MKEENASNTGVLFRYAQNYFFSSERLLIIFHSWLSLARICGVCPCAQWTGKGKTHQIIFKNFILVWEMHALHVPNLQSQFITFQMKCNRYKIYLLLKKQLHFCFVMNL